MAASYMHCNNHIFWHADLTRTYMPPKKTRAAARKYGVRNGLEEKEVKRVDSGNLGKSGKEEGAQEPSAGDKRKKSATPDEAIKAPKTEASPKPNFKVSPVQVLKFLLSDAALPLCRPPDELTDIEDRGANITTYSQLLSPFEELLCAVILSRPISHRLGMRTIRTILNTPYDLRNPVAIKTAGPKKVLQALEEARTQHKDKTAEEIELLAQTVSNNDWHNDLSKLRAQAKNTVKDEREVLQRSIEGLGKTGLDIFYRRVQWQWEEAYPFIDSRTQDSLEKLGLPRRAEGIAKMIEVRWEELGFEEGSEYSLEEKRRRAFVVLLERAVGADLEQRVEEVLEGAENL